ncbi:MAG: proline--tRNA ligase [Verrucomicrobia bacterium]|jgi:prolyl-tRNA synthetase|nr:proline--tRNA ligase [Verrucomicrobiota bacterium]
MTKQGRKTAIQPTREENYPEWYQQVIRAAELAENSPVRGCMVIKPWGYGLWENFQKVLDGMFKETGHRNAYFPLFIPKSYLEKEAEHVEGFAKECAVVTHSRLEAGPDGKLHPASELEEPLVVRPTSETIIGEMYARWVQSYRDLPILINQWANVVRWEMRTRLFLRTAEFLWQEGHTAHATKEEALEETRRMLDVYARFAEEYMAMPVLVGEKPESERFPGAISTLCIEAMMQDRKALQAGTSHFLGQNFAKASGIQFLDDKGEQQYAWTTSWGVSTRLIGGLVMTHSDDDGLILPPRLAPAQVVILPVIPKEQHRGPVMEACRRLYSEIRDKKDDRGEPLRVELDDRDLRGGEKSWQWVKRGIPLRVEIGPRDLEKDGVFVARRDTGEKEGSCRAEFLERLPGLLEEIQAGMHAKALRFREENTRILDSERDFRDFFTPGREGESGIHGGFVYAHFSGDSEVIEDLQKGLKVTIRCLPFGDDAEPGTCIFTGKPSARRMVFAKAY